MNAQSSGKIIPKVTIASRSITISEVFKLIRKQTGKVIWYRNEDINENKKVTVNFKDASLEDVLRYLFQASDISWTYDDEAIILRKKKLSENSNPSTTLTDTSLSTIQLITVTGKVTDEKGSPIIGATVVLKGTRTGTISDSNGDFLITDVPSNAVLTISSISFATKDFPIKKRTVLGNLILNRYEKVLDDVIVLAYTKTTNRLLTGNVSSVKAKDIQNSPVNNPILAAAGRIPGITITQSSGFANSGIEILIQGINSLQKGVSPFYVIDGMPYIQSLTADLGTIFRPGGRGEGAGPNLGNPLSFINPSDIESIQVLKDADATAIYGSRAANGAIIITTKRGKSGKMKLDLIMQTGWGTVARKLDLMNTKEYLTVRREAFSNDNITNIPSTAYDLNGTWDSTKYTDWQKELLGGKAKYSDIQLGISGGNTNLQYLIGSNYHRETTVFQTDAADVKASVRVNLDVNSNDKKILINFSGSYLADNNELPLADQTRAAMTLPPNMPDLKKADGSLNFAPNSSGVSTITSNPLASLNSQYKSATNSLLSNLVLNYKPMQNILLKLNLGYNNMQTNEYTGIPLSAFNPERRTFAIRRAEFGFNSVKSWVIEPQIHYNLERSFGNLTVVVGSTIQQTTKSRNRISASGFSNDWVMSNLNAATTVSIPFNSILFSEYKYNAAFIQLNYNYQDRYLVNISGRRDGSSRFGIQSRFHNFGSIGAAWIFSNELGIKDLFPFLSFGKIKGSIGTTGNDQIGDYAYESLYRNNNGDIPYRGGSSLAIDKINNAHLQWETTRKLSIGLDLGFLQDKIYLNTVYYRNRSSNMLIQATIPATSGPILGLVANLPAVIQNYGFELSITTTQLRTKAISWSTNANITIPKNNLSSFPGLSNSPYSNVYVIGQPSNLVKRFRSSGVNPTTGQYEFLDKDGKTTNSPSSDPLNYSKNINPNPTLYGGISNTLTLKRFSLDFLVQYVKQKAENLPFDGVNPGQGMFNFTKGTLDRWQKPGDVKSVQKLTTSNFDLINAYRYQLSSDAYWEDASFVRLKNVALSYDFGENLLNRIRFNSLRVFVNAQNLLTFTPYKGLDPETKSNFSLPPLRVLTFGIQASL
ncbi:SusC/RagA family TonB-linked outer membrane protein [Chitinophaga tropicalis]|nr:SusC/RagA family TonB-linked outer membrane protein [Chitinophaga tropicalis]